MTQNLQGQGQQQPLQAMIQGSVNAYASMLNSALFPFLLYQQSLAMTTQVALGGLRAATRVAQQGTQVSSRSAWRRSAEAAEGAVQSDMRTAQQSTGLATGQTTQQSIEIGDEDARQSVEATGQAAQDNAEVPGRDLRQDVEAVGETIRESDAETTDRVLPEVDEVAPSPSESVPLISEGPNTMDELPPPSAPEALDEPTAEVIDETDQGNTEMSGQAHEGRGEAAPNPSYPMELPPPPEVPSILDELPPPPEVASIIEELPPPPDPLEESTAQATPRETPQVRVRRTTAAARRKAEQLNVDLAEVEGTGQKGQIIVEDVHRKARERRS